MSVFFGQKLQLSAIGKKFYAEEEMFATVRGSSNSGLILIHIDGAKSPFHDLAERWEMILEIPATEPMVSLHSLYCDCARCAERTARK